MRRVLLVLLFVAPSLLAQKKTLTFDELYNPEKRVELGGAIQSGFVWIDATHFYWPASDASGDFVEWRLYDTKSGKTRPLFDREAMQRALVATGLKEAEAAETSRSDRLTFDAKADAVVFEAGGDLYEYAFGKKSAVRLTSAAGTEEIASFSPDGRSVAFVRSNDLFVVDAGGHEHRLTTDGNEQVLNGKLDWMYQEEIYGRGDFRGYWWSPDSSRIAFLRLDESRVPRYTLVDDIDYQPELDVYPYPRAGDPNPIVNLKIANVAGDEVVTIDNARYEDPLVVRVAWRPDSSVLTYQVQNREQTWLELIAATLDGRSHALVHDTTQAWVDPLTDPVWLGGGAFLWQSERSGWRHVYLYDASGAMQRQVTRGDWEVRDVLAADEHEGWIYFAATERSPIGLDVYRVRFDGTRMQRLTSESGTHRALFAPSTTQFIDDWSDIATPDRITLRRADGRTLRVVEANGNALVAQYDLPKPEFLQVKARDGFVMEAMIIRPPGFDPSKKYPVYQYLYGGPHAPLVENRWRGRGFAFLQFLAQQGVIVWQCDNRSASGKGAVSEWPIYRNFGELELRDVEDGIRWLTAQPYVDASRVMLHGWSYGGYMVSYALTHSTMFRAGIAGGSVTDWRDYDTVYTERYMGLPQKNEEAYRRSSPRFAAANLHGDLLLIHGSIDENVHVQNTLQFAYELEKEGKQFRMMVYPKSRHGVVQPALQRHMNQMVVDFLTDELLRPAR